jgi:gluconolactonase
MTARMSRRRALTTVAGGLVLASAGIRASAQVQKRIEQLAPELDGIISTSEPIQELASGFGGELGPAEGPVWWKEGGYLLFNDIHNNRRMKYVPGQRGVTVDLAPTNRANGLTRDPKGRLVACEHDTRRVTRRELDGSLTVVANSFQGRRLNRPNDVIARSDGCYYFTDPNHNFVPEQWDLTFPGVYRVTPDLGTLSLVNDTFLAPNGLAFSPDEKLMYVNDTRRGHIRAFEMLPNGLQAKQTDRVFADLRGNEPGVPDGMKVDSAGNVYCGGAGGIWIMDPHGKKLGRIVHGHNATTNIAFGGDDWKTLYFTSREHLGAVTVKIPGVPVPVKGIG